MSQIDHKEFTVDLQLKSIELLRSLINLPVKAEMPLTSFNFNINLESRADASNKVLFVIVSVDIRSEDQSHILGSLSASCIYGISNFDEVVKFDTNGKLEIHQGLAEIVNSISISTIRGMMYSAFKGTFLHNAFLPIVDPRSFKPSEPVGQLK